MQTFETDFLNGNGVGPDLRIVMGWKESGDSEEEIDGMFHLGVGNVETGTELMHLVLEEPERFFNSVAEAAKAWKKKK